MWISLILEIIAASKLKCFKEGWEAKCEAFWNTSAGDLHSSNRKPWVKCSLGKENCHRGNMVLHLKLTNVEDKLPSSARGVILMNLFLFSHGCMDHVSIIMAGRTMVIRQLSLFYFTTGYFGLVFWLWNDSDCWKNAAYNTYSEEKMLKCGNEW